MFNISATLPCEDFFFSFLGLNLFHYLSMANTLFLYDQVEFLACHCLTLINKVRGKKTPKNIKLSFANYQIMPSLSEVGDLMRQQHQELMCWHLARTNTDKRNSCSQSVGASSSSCFLLLSVFFLCCRCDSENRYLGNPLRGTCYCE